jgi:hypothetical protein
MFTTDDAAMACMYLEGQKMRARPYRIGNGELVIRVTGHSHDFFLWDWENFDAYRRGRLLHLGVRSYATSNYR